MRAVYCDSRSVGLRDDLPEPRPEQGEVVLKVRAVGICDTDLQLARGYMGFQGILGHEFLGETSEGQRVTAEINNACHACSTCLQGRTHHCPNRSVLGILNHDGAMADRVAVPARNLHQVPDAIDDLHAVFIEPLAAAFRVTEQVELGPGVSMAILGDGKLGTLCAWVARLMGADTHLIGKHHAKLALAGKNIRTHLLETSDSLEHTFDVVADCTGSKTGLPTALRLVRPCGTIVLKTTVAGEYGVDLAPIVIDEVRVVGSRCGPFPRAIDALAAGQIDVQPLIDSVYSLDEAEKAFEAAGGKGAKKVLIEVAGRGHAGH
jgi:threonine dehydrogenase-like Zn-dependent dehydrogenase